MQSLEDIQQLGVCLFFMVVSVLKLADIMTMSGSVEFILAEVNHQNGNGFTNYLENSSLDF